MSDHVSNTSHRRRQAQHSVIYLRRRVGDFVDLDQPAPRWSQLDCDAVSTLVREFTYLERSYELAVKQLRQHGLRVAIPTDDDALAEWIEYEPAAVPRRRWRFWSR